MATAATSPEGDTATAICANAATAAAAIPTEATAVAAIAVASQPEHGPPEPTHVELFEIFTRLGEESPHMQAQIAKLASASRLACSDLQALAGEAAQISQITEEPLRYTAGRLYHDTLKSFKSSFALEAHPPPTVSVLPLGGEGGFSSSSAATIAVDDKPTDGSA